MAEQARGGDVCIDVDALETDLQNMISVNLSMSLRCCIFRVPNILLNHNSKAYKPNAFSIGPFYYKARHLKATQKIKVRYLSDLVSRFPNKHPDMKLRDLTVAISEVGKKARECYAGPINISMDEFVKVLVLDGCFLIELFRKHLYLNLRKEDDPIFSRKYMLQLLYHDLILLENQIPWLVLQCLFEMTETQEDKCSLNGLAIAYFRESFSRNVIIFHKSLTSIHNVMHEHKHLLDLLRNSMVLPSCRARDVNWITSKVWNRMPSATSLREAGIKFKDVESKTDTASILDIKFKDGVLEIPQLHIHETTESLFRNLICFEQCLPHCEGVITSYAILLDHLINTANDMEVLCKSGVIYNWLDTEDATKFFNQLYHDTCVSAFHYLTLINEVNEHCRRRWPKYRRVLTHDYFKHPWALISVIVAAILLILTFLQTLFTIVK